MKTNFPTIKQMIQAVLCLHDAYKVIYQQDDYSFKVINYVPFPVYYGGSMDSVDFREESYTITYKQAYNCWCEMIDPNPYLVPPVCPPKTKDYDEYYDLPF